jgi:glutathione S-transferase
MSVRGGWHQRPALYSFRRCPYAIRARLALAASGLSPETDLQLREVSLKAKPAELLRASAKGTVPVLVLPADGTDLDSTPADSVLEESLTIMRWALERHDPLGWWAGWSAEDRSQMAELLAENDGPFKHHLDRFKYGTRFGTTGAEQQEQHRRQALAILQHWNRRLAERRWLLGDRCSLADWALLPFVRQFRLADPQGFEAEPALESIQHWLTRFLEGPELAAVMTPPWAPRAPWRSPGWLYHLALRSDWLEARGKGVYSQSTRGQSLEDVGFIHLSRAEQVPVTASRFYSDLPADELLLLTLDPNRLREAALEVRFEPAAPSGELFPHLYGPLPLEAVLLAQRFQR